MPDLTPPPDRPLPDQSRARIRAELLAAADGDVRRSGPPRWAIPVVAAAGVVVVAGLGAWAVHAGSDTGQDTGPALAPASTSATDTPSLTPTTVTSSHHPRSGGRVGSGSCDVELENVLPGATQAAAFDDGTSFWVKGDQFALCDSRMGETTVHHPLPLTPAERVETYQVSSVFAPADGNGFTDVRVAGGVVPDGMPAYDAAYTFPDGETVHSETITGGGHTWWRVVHTYPDLGTSELKQDPIRVVVSYPGVQKTYTLQWGLDTCAQANHGC